METLLILTYLSICWVIFKIFKIPVNKWSLTTVVLGGVAMLGTIMAGMAYFHPASHSARSYFFTTPIVSNVRGKIIEVVAQPNVPLQAGDILAKIDPIPFQAQVDNIKAQLDLSRKRLEESRALVAARAGSMFEVERYAAEVLSLEAQLVDAQFDLDSTVIRAPTNGYITHVRLRPGMIAVPLAAFPLMTFVHSEESLFVAGFSQQPMQNIKVGNHAEVVFPGVPGRVFQARVNQILNNLAEGQLMPSAMMVTTKPNSPEGAVMVGIEFTEDMTAYYLPAGSIGTVAVYSERRHHVTIIRKILLRMQSWRNFARFH
jgi:multidrug resistance efflux pump